MKKRMKFSVQLAACGLIVMAFLAKGNAQQAAAPKPPAASPAQVAKPAAPSTAPKASTPSAAAAQAPAAASSPRSAETGDRVVLKVGDQQATEGDLQFLIGRLGAQAQQAITQQGRRPLGEQLAVMLILAARAKSHHADANADFRRQVEFFQLQTLAQSEYQTIANEAVVTPEDVQQYYASHNTEFEEAQLREVILRKKADDAAADDPGLTTLEAKTRAGEIRTKLAATDVSKVAQEFSQPNVVLFDPRPRAVRHGQLLPDVEKAAFQLKDGEISEPIEIPQALILVQMVGRRQVGLPEVTKEIESTLRQQKVDAALADLRNKAAIWMDDAYFAAPAPASANPQTAPPKDSTLPPQH
ncbi:MAG: peptidylprolyl isomerase [Acidobacteriia bacterium]|nr:peptidylprolyl isomerase [Terriglobia bacterium]